MAANGILVIDKPSEWTSMDVCAKLRGAFHEKRIGHAGTLDPMATGVLPVFVGRATRAVEFASESNKEYIADIKLGVITDTQDRTGTVLETRPVTAGRTEVEAALAPLRGEILQVPPMYSAVKVGGKKLYELARKGKEVERRARPVTIHALELLEGGDPEAGEYRLRVLCSKGTYIRTLCHDLGQALGCGAALAGLRRTQAAGFGLDRAVRLEDVLAAAVRGEAERLLLPVDAYFGGYPALTVDEAGEKRVRNGGSVRAAGRDGTYRVYGPGGAFLMLGRLERGTLKTIKSFYEV